MVRTKNKDLLKSIIIIGFILAVLGLSVHLAVPSTTRSGSPVRIGALSYAVDHLDYELGGVEYTFRLYVKFFGFQNLSAYLLIESEYESFSLGTSLNELDFIAEFLNSVDSVWETTLTDNLDVYLILLNNNTYDTICGYYYVIVPITFFVTLTVGFVGLFLVLCGLGWYMTGWRRYFILGFSINLVIFYIRIFTLVNYRIGFPDLFGIPYLFDWFIEPYNDYQFFYLRWVPSLWEGVWPYTLDTSNPMIDYIYPPLWLYTIGMLGSVPSWLPGLILFTFNMATGIIVYHISRELTNDEKKSIFTMMLYLLNPFTFFYGSFLWLNPTPYVFFLTLSFWLALKDKGELSVVAMAIATLYKQFAVIFYPLLILGLIKKNKDVDFRKTIQDFMRYNLVYAVVVGVISLPFLLVDYQAYIARVLFWDASPESLATFHPQSSWPMNFNTFFVWLGIPYEIALGIGYLIAYYVLLGVPTILIYIDYARFNPSEEKGAKKQEGKNNRILTEAFFWTVLLILFLQLFYPRGTYKFYLTALVPFISLLFDYRDLKLSRADSFVLQRYHLFSLVISWLIFLCFRLVYFWILLAWIFFYLGKGGYITNFKVWINKWRNRGKSVFVE